MTKIGKLWTGAVAYVSLLVGAGLSVAGNLADTYRTRGDEVDALDKVMAAGWPILVLLAIEMFVSPRWSTSRMFQVWRWVGCLAVGGMAMVVSWTHLHDLMSSRGQLFIVSVLGPLAIDGMAIMATGLILSTRVRGHVRTDIDGTAPRLLDVPRVPSDTDMDNLRTRWDMSRDMMTDTVSHADMSEGQRQDMADRLRTAMDNLSPEIGTGVSQPVPPSGFGDIDWDSELSELSGQDAALTALGQDVSRTAEALSNGTDTVLPQRTRLSGGSVPAGFLDTLRTWNPDIMSPADFKRTAAGTHGVSVKTVGRWMDREMSQDDPRRRR